MATLEYSVIELVANHHPQCSRILPLPRVLILHQGRFHIQRSRFLAKTNLSNFALSTTGMSELPTPKVPGPWIAILLSKHLFSVFLHYLLARSTIGDWVLGWGTRGVIRKLNHQTMPQ